MSEQDDLGRGQPVGAEERQSMRHRDSNADAEVAERQPPLLGEEGVRDRRADLTSRAGAHPEHGLDAVVDEGVGCDRDERAVGRERSDGHGLTRHSESVHLGGRSNRAGRRIEDRRVPCHALAHARARADHHERGGLQARQQLVEIVVAGGQACDRLAAVVELLEPAEADLEQVVDGRDRVGNPALGDVIDHRLRAIDGLGDVVGDAVTELGDLAGDADEPPQQRVLFDDVRVAGRIRDRRRRRLQVDQDARARRSRRAGQRAAAPLRQ